MDNVLHDSDLTTTREDGGGGLRGKVKVHTHETSPSSLQSGHFEIPESIGSQKNILRELPYSSIGRRVHTYKRVHRSKGLHKLSIYVYGQSRLCLSQLLL